MVNYLKSSLDTTFAALADPTRRAILERLSRRQLSVTQVAEPFSVSLPAISKQLRVLEQAGLLMQEKQGRIRLCRLVAEPMKETLEWLSYYREFWEGNLDALADLLDQLQQEDEPS